MAEKKTSKIKGVRIFPPPPKGFDALAASKRDLVRHGIPERPDPRTQPAVAALWERLARRYQDFEHLKPQLRRLYPQWKQVTHGRRTDHDDRYQRDDTGDTTADQRFCIQGDSALTIGVLPRTLEPEPSVNDSCAFLWLTDLFNLTRQVVNLL